MATFETETLTDKYSVKALFYTQIEADEWQKVPIYLTYGDLARGTHEVKAFTKFNEVFQVEVTSLCIWINDTAFHKILFEDGRIFSLEMNYVHTERLRGKGVYGDGKHDNLLDYLKDIHGLLDLKTEE